MCSLPILTNHNPHSIYLNDDFFFMKDLHAADFHTPSFGLVFRLLSWPGLQSNPEEISTKPANGEWRPLEYTNFLLSKRFGFRKRPYPTHVAKVGALPLMQEMVRVWSDEFATTARHKFRGERGDAYMMTGFVHFVVERHREAMLWTYVVGRIGGDRDEWGTEQRRRVWTELGGGSGTVGGSVLGGRTLTVQVIKRQTLAEERVKAALDATGDALGGTRYQFCELCGSFRIAQPARNVPLTAPLLLLYSEPRRLPVWVPRRPRRRSKRTTGLVADLLQHHQFSRERNPPTGMDDLHDRLRRLLRRRV